MHRRPAPVQFEERHRCLRVPCGKASFSLSSSVVFSAFVFSLFSVWKELKTLKKKEPENVAKKVEGAVERRGVGRGQEKVERREGGVSVRLVEAGACRRMRERNTKRTGNDT